MTPPRPSLQQAIDPAIQPIFDAMQTYMNSQTPPLPSCNSFITRRCECQVSRCEKVRRQPGLWHHF
jgi:hypothetical protein